MADDVKLEILLQAKNQSEQAFRDLKNQLSGLQQDMAKTAKAAESSFNLDVVKTKLMAAAGAIYGAYKTIEQAVDMAAAGSKLEKQAAAFGNLSAAAGTSAARMLESLRQVSGGMVAEADLISAAGKAMLMNIPAGEITKLMEIAAATSKSTGQTITEAFNDITMGVARQSKMILDNLGIIVDVDKANQDYAKTLGKTADALSDTEKRLAFMNSVMKSGEDMIKRIGASAGSLDNVNKLIASHSNLWDEVNKTVATFLDNKLPRYASWLDEITEKLKGLRAAGAEGARSDMLKDVELLRSLEGWWGKVKPGTTMSKMNEFNQRFVGASESELANQAAWRDWQKPDAMAAWREREGQWVEYTEEEKKAMVAARDKALADIAKQKPAKSIWEGWGVRPYTESEAFLADQKAWEDYKKLWSSYEQRLPESQQSEAMLADQAAWDEWKKNGEDSMNYLTELSEHTAERMQNNFSTFFFDAFRGELKSLEDYVNAMFETFQRGMADMAGQAATQAIFGAKSVGGTAGGGGLIGWLGGLLGTAAASAKGNAFGAYGMERFAAGGVITRPTVFPFARGIGLMGEAGPEAVMPLRRMSNGRLGVEASGGMTVHMPITVVAPEGRMNRESASQVGHAAYMGLKRAWARNA